MTYNRNIAPSTAYGCCLLALAVWFIWLIVLWWMTGILVDWINVHYAMGWIGNTTLAFHLLAFVVLGAITSALGRVTHRSSS